jgi:hypothetical protein
MTRCSHCRGKLGMVSYPRSEWTTWYHERFCSKKCRDAFLNRLAADRDRVRKWLGYLRPG